MRNSSRRFSPVSCQFLGTGHFFESRGSVSHIADKTRSAKLESGNGRHAGNEAVQFSRVGRSSWSGSATGEAGVGVEVGGGAGFAGATSAGATACASALR
jgi:hypothetical protein